MIGIRDLEKDYGERCLFREASFTVGPRERVGLVGLNGSGKTTLFRLISGREEADGGEIVIPRGYRIGWLEQESEFEFGTVLAETCRGLDPELSGERWRAEKALSGLGFSESDFSRSPDEFSEGYRARIALARTLVSEPNLLLLDEPTNFLDILSIRWLVRFLQGWKYECMIVSHDRSFLDAVCTHIVGIHRRRIRKIAGRTWDYYSMIAREEDTWEKTRLNEERRRKQVEEFIGRFRAQARHAGLVQSRIKALEKRGVRERLEKIRTLSFSFTPAPSPARYVLEARELDFAWPGSSPLIRDFNLTVEKNDRICIAGPNGRGKTTLLRLLAGELSPDAGTVRIHPRACPGLFFPAHASRLHGERTVEEEVASARERADRQETRRICGAMLFGGDDALKKIGVLSGGERCRVLLAQVLASPANLLLLDEPTHHLDLDSSEALLEALDQFPGAVIVVTHNEHFIRRLSGRLVVFPPSGGHMIYPGDYDDFVSDGGWEETSAGGSRPEAEAVNRKEARRRRAEINRRRAADLEPLERRARDLEERIAIGEETIAQADRDLIRASRETDKEKIVELSRLRAAAGEEVAALYRELEDAASRLDRARDSYAAPSPS
ncbi:MAG TPA: ABC-F family ATP-binding cassette domain-containing protein [bacterium]|nr:ABC-F family ATP-binding cassette domain-containing protein [bacterium]HPJ71070.1 ABC-F family ATP-binding cassette domain-containing protein [bacterium]HPQ65850.1 ABC-F family ATP-binding cassette domain-containing protein [bacterium]